MKIKTSLTFKSKSINYNNAIMIIFWFLFILFSVFEGYFVNNIGGLTRYIIMAWIIYMLFILKGKIFTVTYPQLAMIIWLLYYLFSILWSKNVGQAKVYLLTISLMVMVYVVVQYFAYNDKTIQKILTMYKISSCSIGVLSLFFYTYIGAGTRRVLYIFGTFIDPNNQVAILAVGSGLCMLGLLSGNLKKRLWNFLGLILTVYSIFQCGSRSGIVILTLQIMIIILFWHPKENNFIKESLKWSVFIFGGIIVVYLISQYVAPEVVDRLFGRGNLKFTDGTEREVRWGIAFNYIKNSPIFGNGWGSYECHNTFLTMLVDIGLFGNVFFYYVIIRLIYKVIKRRDLYSIMILISGLVPAFFIGAQNKRFFWISIILVSIITDCNRKEKIC